MDLACFGWHLGHWRDCLVGFPAGSNRSDYPGKRHSVGPAALLSMGRPIISSGGRLVGMHRAPRLGLYASIENSYSPTAQLAPNL